MLKSTEKPINVSWNASHGGATYINFVEIRTPKRKQHSKYSWFAKNSGKDLIFKTRLRLAEKMGLRLATVENVRLWSYLFDAESGIILH